MQLTRIERVTARVTVTAKLADGTPATVTGVSVALLGSGAKPTVGTTWTTATFSAGVATVLLAGPDADPTAALVLPLAGADLWIRDVENPEVTATMVDHISVS